MRSAIRQVWSWLWIPLSAAVVLSAVFLTLIRVLIPLAGEYRSEAEAVLGAWLGQPIRIAAMEAEWQGFGPKLRLDGLELLDKDAAGALIEFDEAFVGLDLMTSLWEQRLAPDSLELVGVRLSIVRQRDGGLSVEGLGQRAEPARQASGGRLLQWLFRLPALGIERAEIVWHDILGDANPVRFTEVSLHLNNRGDRHWLDGRTRMPDAFGESFEFVLDLRGEAHEPERMAGALYAKGRNIQLGQWLTGHHVFGSTSVDGRLDLEGWGELRAGQLQRFDASVLASDLRLRSPTATGSAALAALAGQLSWQRTQAGGWSLLVERMRVQAGGQSWPETHVRVAAAPGSQNYALDAGFLDVGDIGALLAGVDGLDPWLRDALRGLQPRGQLRRVRGYYAGDGPVAERFMLHADLRQGAWQQWGRVPAMRGIGGVVWHDGRSGWMKLDGRKVRLVADGLFRQPIDMAAVTGHVSWLASDHAWQVAAPEFVAANDDLRIQANMKLEIPHDGASPLVDLVASYQASDGAAVSRYYPTGIMRSETVAWLDRSIVSGQVPWGGLVLRGRLKEFPFTTGEGRFEARFKVTDGIVDYAKDWPRVEEVEAEVAFQGRRMDIEAAAGKILNADIGRAKLTIPLLRRGQSVLSVRGHARADASEVVRFVAESPLDERFGNYLLGMTARGSARVDVDLTIPLKKKRSNRIRGTLTLQDGEISKQGWDVKLTSLNGKLKFTDKSLAGQGIRARLLGKPARIDVSTETITRHGQAPVARKAMVIAARTRMSIAEAGQQFAHPLLAHAAGTTDWHIRLIVPEAEWRESVEASVRVESDLDGVQVRLPAPLGKSAAERRALAIETNLVEDPAGLTGVAQRLLTLSYGEQINGAFIIQERPAGVAIERGEVNFGGRPGNLPRPGLRIAGHIPLFSMKQWWRFLAPDVTRKMAPGEFDLGSEINEVDLTFGELDMLGYDFRDVRLSLGRRQAQWRARLDGPDIAGTVNWQDNIRAAPAVLAFDRLFLARAGTPEPETLPRANLDPRRFPAFRVTTERFGYDGIELGRLELVARPSTHGLTMERLALTLADGGELTAFGSWAVGDGDPRTSVSAKLRLEQLGKILETLGYAATIQGGETDGELVASWLGGPGGFSATALQGTLKLKIKKGRMLAVEPGAGRVFGLLSVQALPRRLSLDFSDLFQKGFAFDSVVGEFALESGNAFTNGLVMEGPAARIDISGRTGLVARDYDQLVTVTPKVSASLPLAGALFGGPAVGAALLAIERVVRPAIDEITRYHYTIRGSWSDPEVVPLSKDDL